MMRTLQYALEHKGTGEESHWYNRASGHQGDVKPTRTYRNSEPREYESCREFRETLSIFFRVVTVYRTGTSCRTNEGSWVLVGASRFKRLGVPLPSSVGEPDSEDDYDSGTAYDKWTEKDRESSSGGKRRSADGGQKSGGGGLQLGGGGGHENDNDRERSSSRDGGRDNDRERSSSRDGGKSRDRDKTGTRVLIGN